MIATGRKDPITRMAIARLVEMGVPEEVIMKHVSSITVTASAGQPVVVEMALWLAPPKEDLGDET